VAEGGGLLNRCRVSSPTVSSNLIPSANQTDDRVTHLPAAAAQAGMDPPGGLASVIAAGAPIEGTCPMTATLPSGWPVGRELAVSVSVMLEGWTDGAAPGVGPMGNVLKAGTLDLQARSWAKYGVNAGAQRLLDVLATAGVHAVFYVSGILAERHPALLRVIAEAGHPIAAHGWGQEIIPATQTPEDERADLLRCVAALDAASGRPPAGWLSPRCTPSARTTALLAAHGFVWHADYFDNDLPRSIATPSGPVTAVPFTMEVNDMPLSVRYGNEPEAYTRTLERILEGWPTLSPRRLACLDVTVHAHVFGRVFGAIEFARSLALLKAHAATSWTTNHDVLGRMFAPG
jgi:peptidoglycan/xylan/chitin deacetylase (PgdA/CDA1 family)